MSQHPPLVCWLAFVLSLAAVMAAGLVIFYDKFLSWLERRYAAHEERQWRKDLRRRGNDRSSR